MRRINQRGMRMGKLRHRRKLIKIKGMWEIHMEAYCLITQFKTVIGRDSRTP